MALFGNVTKDIKGHLKFLGQCTFTQGLIGIANGGNIYYVDSSRSASGKGDRWGAAFITIAEAVAKALADGGHHDTILVKGTENTTAGGVSTNDYDEAVTVAISQVGLRIIGMGNGPEGIFWNADADAACLTVNAKDCYVSGFRFRPEGAGTGCGILLVTDATMTTDPSGFIVENCTFRSTGVTANAGIRIDSTNDVTIRHNLFSGPSTAVSNYATNNSVCYRMHIHDNRVDDKCTGGFLLDGRSCVIENNIFASGLTTIINTADLGAAGKDNTVAGNVLPCETNYATNCVAATGDTWLNNWTNKASEGSETAAGGNTLLPPA